MACGRMLPMHSGLLVLALIPVLLICAYALRRGGAKRWHLDTLFSQDHFPTTVACIVSAFFLVPALIRGEAEMPSVSMWVWAIGGYVAAFVMVHTGLGLSRKEGERETQRAMDVLCCFLIPAAATYFVGILLGVLFIVALPFYWLFAWMFSVA